MSWFLTLLMFLSLLGCQLLSNNLLDLFTDSLIIFSRFLSLWRSFVDCSCHFYFATRALLTQLTFVTAWRKQILVISLSFRFDWRVISLVGVFFRVVLSQLRPRCPLTTWRLLAWIQLVPLAITAALFIFQVRSTIIGHHENKLKLIIFKLT